MEQAGRPTQNNQKGTTGGSPQGASPPRSHQSDGRPSLAELMVRLGYAFRRQHLLRQALVHRSALPERKDCPESNETFEFLGDAVLDLHVTASLIVTFPQESEGSLSMRRTSLVSEPALAKTALALELGRWIILGKGEVHTGGIQRPSILASALEAILGAAFLDGGYEATQKIVSHLKLDQSAESIAPGSDDPKTRFQELAYRHFQALPVYTVIQEDGPDHAKQYTMEVSCKGIPYGKGTGTSKKLAGQAAARQALLSLESRVPTKRPQPTHPLSTSSPTPVTTRRSKPVAPPETRWILPKALLAGPIRESEIHQLETLGIRTVLPILPMPWVWPVGSWEVQPITWSPGHIPEVGTMDHITSLVQWYLTAKAPVLVTWPIDEPRGTFVMANLYGRLIPSNPQVVLQRLRNLNPAWILGDQATAWITEYLLKQKTETDKLTS